MKSRSLSFALILALAAMLAYQSIAAVNAAPQPPVTPSGSEATNRPAASCGLLSFARRDYHFSSALLVQASGDFNGDGKPDLVGFDGTDNAVAVLLNDGHGGYITPTTYPLGSYPASALVVGDFNSDGKLDLAITIIDSQTDQHNAVILLLGRGDGTFEPGSNAALSPYPGAIAAADFNHDGKLDLVVNNADSAFLWLLLGNGDGTFQPLRVLWVGNIPGQPLVGDFNDDGNPDVAVINEASNSVALLLGKGDGTFQSPAFFPVGSFPIAAVVGDFNGDGKLDLVVTNGVDSRNPRIILLAGDGSGRFAPATIYSPGYYPGGITASDLDGDGNLDLLILNGTDNTITVWRGDGAGGFSPPVGYSVGQGSGPIVVADLSGDGKPDLITTDSSMGDITELINTCAPSTATPPTSTPNIPTNTPIPTDTPYPTTTPCVIPFTDIDGNPFQQAIEYLHCYQVVNGYGSSYHPAEIADRAQFAKVAMIGFGLYSYGHADGQYFSDVPSSHYAYKYVGMGYQAGVLNGFDAATCAANGATYPCFLPERTITRGELTKMVVLTGFFPLVTPGRPTFSDVPPSNPFYPYIETAYAQHIISGYPDGTFRPNENIRRDQMAGIVYKGIINPNWGLAGKAARHRP